MCDTLVSLPASTRRGAVLFAKNSDRERNEAQALEFVPARRSSDPPALKVTYIEIPDVQATHACLISRPFWMWGAEMGANAHGVVIGNEALHARVPAQRRRALIGMDLVRLGLERAATAAEAVEVITGLLERHGQGGDCGHLGRFYYQNGFIVADPREAYVLETVGRDWVLQRVRERRALSNAYSIGADFEAISPGLADQGRAASLGARFDVAAFLIDEARDAASFGRGRCARGQALLDGMAPGLTPASMMSILRDHGDDPDWSPANTRRRTICMHAAQGPRRSQSVASMVSELAPGRTIHWVTATSAPCLSVFKPLAFGAGLPDLGPALTDRFDARTAWWRHEQLHRRALAADFGAILAAVAPERDALEAEFQDRIDRALDTGGLDAAIESCWRDAADAEARWAALPGPARSAPSERAHRRSWARLNGVAGFAP